MKPISVCMIAKNEEKNIAKCLGLLRPHFAEIVVVDTGSGDRTMAIAAEYADKVVSFEWVGDFAAARNFSIEQASHDWILVVDCDEFLTEIDLAATGRLMNSYPQGIGMIVRDNPHVGGQTMTERVARLFDRRFHHYRGSIHEQAAPIGGGVPAYFAIPLRFFHEGYSDKETAMAKARRNLDMLLAELEKNGSDPYTHFQIGQSLKVLDDIEGACRHYALGLSFDLNPGFEYVQTMVESYGYVLLELGRHAEALSFEGIYESFAKRADFLFLMGLIYMNNARFDRAIAEFEKATQMSTYAVAGVNSYSAYYNIGVIYECMGDVAAAREYYRKCGDYAPALGRLGEMVG